MAARKYLVLKTSDLRTLLTQQDQIELAGIMGRLEQSRLASGKPSNDFFFTLNMKDRYALNAVEKYIEQIDEDDENKAKPGIQAARQAAYEARTYAIMSVPGDKLPD